MLECIGEEESMAKRTQSRNAGPGPGGQLRIAAAGVLGKVSDPIVTVRFSADGRLLYTAAWDNLLQVWDLPTRTVLREFPVHAASVVVSPDGQWFAFTHTDVTQVRSRTGEVIALLPGHGVGGSGLALSADGRVLAVGYRDGQIGLWHVLTHAPLLFFDAVPPLERATPPSHFVEHLSFAPAGTTGHRLACVCPSAGGLAQVWEIGGLDEAGAEATPTTRWMRALVAPDNSIAAMAYSPDGSLLVIGEFAGNTLWLFDGASLSPLRTLQVPSAGEEAEFPEVLTFSPDGRFLAVGTDVGRVWI
jgi:WD40 repeat protein